MSKSENINQTEIMLELGRGPTRIFRNHVAKGWTGEFVASGSAASIARTIAASGAEGEYTVIRNARRGTFGLCTGSSDLIGFRKTLITEDMVGRALAVFAAIEVKSSTGRPTAEQAAFIRMVQQFGGRAGVARSAEDARLIIDGQS